MKFIRQMQGLAPLALIEFGDRDSRPAGDDSSDLLICDALMHQGTVLVLNLRLFLLQLLLQLRKPAILEFCCPVQVIGLLRFFNLFVHLFDLLAQLLYPFYANLLIVPLGLLSGK